MKQMLKVILLVISVGCMASAQMRGGHGGPGAPGGGIGPGGDRRGDDRRGDDRRGDDRRGDDRRGDDRRGDDRRGGGHGGPGGGHGHGPGGGHGGPGHGGPGWGHPRPRPPMPPPPRPRPPAPRPPPPRPTPPPYYPPPSYPGYGQRVDINLYRTVIGNDRIDITPYINMYQYRGRTVDRVIVRASARYGMALVNLMVNTSNVGQVQFNGYYSQEQVIYLGGQAVLGYNAHSLNVFVSGDLNLEAVTLILR